MIEKATFGNLILGDAIPVEQHELELDASQPVLALGQVEDEGLVEDRVQGSLLHVGLLLGDTLVVEQEIDLHVGIYEENKLLVLNSFLYFISYSGIF